MGAPAAAKQLRAKTRYLPEITGFHQDGRNSRTNDWNCPLGNSPQVSTRSNTISAQFWHQDGRLTARSVCREGGQTHFCISALDPETLDILGSCAPENRTWFTPYGATTNRTMVMPTLQGHIFEIERIDDTNKTTFSQLRDIDLTDALPLGHSPSSSYYDDDGNIWPTAVSLARPNTIESSHYIGFVNQAADVQMRRLDNQTIENSIAINDGTVYVNSGPLAPEGQNATGYMHEFRINTDGNIGQVWAEEYDSGSTMKPGTFSRGSGSTLALVGDKFIAMTDNADAQVNLVAYRVVAGEKQPNFVCKVPIFQPGASANENAIVGYFDGSTYSIVIIINTDLARCKLSMGVL